MGRLDLRGGVLMGRRPLPPEARRDVDVRIPLAVADRDTLRRATAHLGVELAPWARGVLLRQAARALADLPEDTSLPPAPDATQRAIAATERAIDAALAEVPRLHDTAIAERLGLTSEVVRRRRRELGIESVPGSTARSGWQERIAEAHARGLTVDEIATELRYTRQTVYQRLHQLGLSSHRRARGATP